MMSNYFDSTLMELDITISKLKVATYIEPYHYIMSWPIWTSTWENLSTVCDKSEIQTSLLSYKD